MFYLYVLKSTVRDWKYIGIAADTSKRLVQHNSGGVQSTRPYRPLRLVHQEEFADKKSARQRELSLKKNAKARKDLFEQLKQALIF